LKETKTLNSNKWYLAFRKKRMFLILLAPISFILLWISQNSSYFAEMIFARKIYRGIACSVSFLSGKIPFSIMEIVIKLFLPMVLAGLVYLIIQLIKRKQRGKTATYILLLSLINIGCIASVIFFLYVVMAGINYNRYSFAQISGYTLENSSVQELYELDQSLAVRAAEVRKLITEEGGAFTQDGVIVIDKSNWRELVNTAAAAYEKIGAEYPQLEGNYKSVKAVSSSKVMSAMEITGIFWPFSMEANVNIDVPDYTIPATMLHELAHLRGFMREDEANFISYLVCSNSDDNVLKYSGLMLALSYVGNQLYNQSTEYYEKARALYSDEMNADLRENYYYWVQFEDTVISTASNTINDNYLKANNQSDGVKSYGRMVDLLLAEYKAGK
jgi:hypothetical protein